MAAKRRSGGKRRFPVWLVVILSLLLGAAIMYGVQYFFFRHSKPFPGLTHLAERAGEPGKKQETKPAQPEPEKKPKPKYDFYKILPETETVLPARDEPVKKPAKPEAEQNVRYYLQAAAFDSLAEADNMKARLAFAGLETQIEKTAIEGKGTFYRVRLGPYSKLEDLDAADRKLSAQGIKGLRLKVKKPAK
jgi:cell division protein FtsN